MFILITNYISNYLIKYYYIYFANLQPLRGFKL